jgi:hypothetical protein
MVGRSFESDLFAAAALLLSVGGAFHCGFQGNKHAIRLNPSVRGRGEKCCTAGVPFSHL